MQFKLDPYSRLFLGTWLGFIIIVSGCILENYAIQLVGLDVFLQVMFLTLNMSSGARLMDNAARSIIKALDTNASIRVLQPGEIPTYSVYGISYVGLNGIIKIQNAIPFKVLADARVRPSNFFVRLLNLIGGGFKSKAWAEAQAKKGDPRWLELYYAGLNNV